MLLIQLAAQIRKCHFMPFQDFFLIYTSAVAAYNYHRIISEALMLNTREIHSLTDFLRNHKAHVKRLKKTKTPEVLTVNGKAEVVVQGAVSYQRMQERLHHMETLAAIQEGMASAERGELKPAAQVLDEMRQKIDRGIEQLDRGLGIPGPEARARLRQRRSVKQREHPPN
ncbi:MAG: hypothetical protein WBQ72_07055 [Terriglobales bacterium]|jgi:PHD/YefM family antitoxin component YafN of YafNO toxin-antitoxin module